MSNSAHQHSVSFGLLHKPDTRDLLHPMAAHLAAIAPVRTYRYWKEGVILDQGAVDCPLASTSHPYCAEHGFCVGAGWRQWLQTSPVRYKKASPDLLDIYHQAQLADEFPGINYAGTTARAGAKVMQALGALGEYVWATTVDEVTTWLLTRGPVIAATDWLVGMMNPTDGMIHATGSVVGGHCYLIGGVSLKRGTYRIYQSWGDGWGKHGKAELPITDFASLLANGGDACGAIEVAV